MAGLRTALQRIVPRLLLAALLGFATEGLMWAWPTDRGAVDWALIVAGLIASALVILDIFARWRVRDLYGVAAAGGLFALTYSVLFNPSVTLRELPLSLLTDVMGGHSLISMGVLLLFFVIVGTVRLWAWLGVPLGALIGLCWGIWLRGAPTLGGWDAYPLPADGILILGGAALVVILILSWLTARLAPIPLGALTMNAYEMLIAGGVVIAALYRQFDGGAIDVPTYATLSGLATICAAMLWYRKESYFTWLPTPWTPRPAWLALLATGAAFLSAATVGYGLPPTPDGTLAPFDIIRLSFALFGLIWLPGVVLLIGVKAIVRDIQSKPL
ncbi:MAG: hypothetical protein MUF38_07285 [Anaerolineae bacterium]|jgi:hypothetical protein|nr:hypothetical protein [Anaerolineae bacterium]